MPDTATDTEAPPSRAFAMNLFPSLDQCECSRVEQGQ